MRPQKFPSIPARHFAPGRGASQESAAPARLGSALRWLSPPPSPTSSRLLPLHGCRTRALNSHPQPPPPALRAGDASAPPAPQGAQTRRPPCLAARSLPGASDVQPPLWGSATLTRLGTSEVRGRSRPSQAMPQLGTRPHPHMRRPTRAPPAPGAGPRSSRSSFAAAPRSVCPCAPKQRGPRGCQDLVAGLRPRLWSRAAVAGARQLSLPAPRLRPPGAPPPAPPRLSSPAPRARARAARATGSGVRTGLKGPDVCGRPSPGSRPLPYAPPRPATHALAASNLLLGSN